MKLKRSGQITLLLLPLMLSGCATSALWKNSDLSRFHEPDNPPELAFHQSADARRVLVQYDEIREDDEHVERRAYWLTMGEKSKPNPHRPLFVSCDAARGLLPVPVVTPPGAEPVSPAGLCAVVSTNANEFTLYSDGRSVGCHRLPVYEDSSGRSKKILLTPLAVTADATIIGGVLFAWVWSVGGFTDVH